MDTSDYLRYESDYLMAAFNYLMDVSNFLTNASNYLMDASGLFIYLCAKNEEKLTDVGKFAGRIIGWEDASGYLMDKFNY